MSTVDPMPVGSEGIPPARTPFRIQDPYTGRFVWNKGEDLRLRGNGDGEELLWVLEYAAAGYLLRNVLTGKVLVDESTGGFAIGVKEVDDTTAVLESHIWTMRPVEYEGRAEGAQGTVTERGIGRLFSIRNQRSRAYIVSGFGARGRKTQLRTRITDEESRNLAWRFILMSDPSTSTSTANNHSETESERNQVHLHAEGNISHSNPPSIAPETPPRIVKRKRFRSGDFIHKCRDLATPSQGDAYEKEVKLHDGHFKWKHVFPVHAEYDDPALGRRSKSCSTGEDSCFLQEDLEEDDCNSSSSWMSQPHWQRWISAVSDLDVSWVTPQIGTCTSTALKRKKLSSFAFRDADDHDLLIDSPWEDQPKLEEIP